jgi:hypothetical protein
MGPLSVGVDGDGALEIREDLAVLAEGEPGIYQVLGRGQPVAF